MLNENIKVIRKSKGLSQEELAVKLNVVRQTVSKWERGLSVPDSVMLIRISEVFEIPVSTLLGETLTDSETDSLKAISEKLEIINLQLAKRADTRRKALHVLFILLCVVIVGIYLWFGLIWDSSFPDWDLSDPELAVAATVLNGIEWGFVRVAPLVFIGAIVGFFLTRKK